MCVSFNGVHHLFLCWFIFYVWFKHDLHKVIKARLLLNLSSYKRVTFFSLFIFLCWFFIGFYLTWWWFYLYFNVKMKYKLMIHKWHTHTQKINQVKIENMYGNNITYDIKAIAKNTDIIITKKLSHWLLLWM